MNKNPSHPMRVVAFAEAHNVNGALKPLLGFAEEAHFKRTCSAIELQLFAFRRHPHTGENPLSQAATRIGVNVKAICESKAFDASILRQIRAQFREARPDLILSLATKSHFLVRLLGLHKACPWIAFHHGYTRIDAKNLAYNQLDRWSLRAANTVVTVCDAFVPELRRAGVRDNRIHVLHNFAKPFAEPDADRVRQLARTYGIADRELVVFTAGRLSSEKGHMDLVDAIAKLRHSNVPPFRTIIAGDGPERSALEERVIQAGIADLVTFAGFQNDIAAFYRMSDVFVLPSHSEGSPNVLLEAFSAGLPVVATRAGGVPEMLQSPYPETLLADTKDPDGLAAKLGAVLRDSALRSELREASHCLAGRFAAPVYGRKFSRILCTAKGSPACGPQYRSQILTNICSDPI